VKADAATFEVAEICLDKYFAAQMEQNFQEAGLPITEIPQTVPFLSPAMKETEAAVFGGRFRHDGNPLLRHCVENVKCRVDANGNIFPRHDEGRVIDGASAIFDAIVRAAVAELGGGVYGKDWGIEGPGDNGTPEAARDDQDEEDGWQEL
jgi:phage terminase large subunit-like protein